MDASWHQDGADTPPSHQKKYRFLPAALPPLLMRVPRRYLAVLAISTMLTAIVIICKGISSICDEALIREREKSELLQMEIHTLQEQVQALKESGRAGEAAPSNPQAQAPLDADLDSEPISSLADGGRADGEPDASKVDQVLALWEASPMLQMGSRGDPTVKAVGIDATDADWWPHPPHLEDCKRATEAARQLDSRSGRGDRPLWSLWGGPLGLSLGRNTSGPLGWVEEGEEVLGETAGTVLGPFPPWVAGADEDNLALTRRVQRDIWLHQHPCDCRNKSFAILDFWNSTRLGTGAQVSLMAGVLASAMREDRVLIAGYFDRADHDGCSGNNRGRWSCYFVPVASAQCRAVARQLAAEGLTNWENQRLKANRHFKGRHFWKPTPPDLWGEPWTEIHPTAEAFGTLVGQTKADPERWWRAQAVRYLMRFPSEKTCRLLNRARHDAFGRRFAADAVRALPPGWPEGAGRRRGAVPPRGELEERVWSLHRPLVPRPLVSVHVRQGDKRKEMRLAPFSEYMALAARLRRRFPHLRHIWLSTEMESVVNETREHPGWEFHYTAVPRQRAGQSMHDYELGVGRERSSNNAVVNFLMAADADFFVGALGSTWCYLLDGMRATGGKALQGYLSTNLDRFWR